MIKLYNTDSYSFLKDTSLSFNVTITDPPYGIDIKGIDGKVWDKEYPSSVFWNLLFEKSSSNSWLASFSGIKNLHKNILKVEEGGWEIKDTLAWIKPYAIGRKNNLKRGWEAIILASKGNPLLYTNQARISGKDIPEWPSQDLPNNNKALNIKRGNPKNRQETRHPSSVILAAEDEGFEYDKFFIVGRATTKEKGEFNNHPSVKPLSLIRHLVLLLSSSSDLILDPFMGSGTAAVVCKELNRNFVGVELDEEYYKIAERRIAE